MLQRIFGYFNAPETNGVSGILVLVTNVLSGPSWLAGFYRIESGGGSTGGSRGMPLM